MYDYFGMYDTDTSTGDEGDDADTPGPSTAPVPPRTAAALRTEKSRRGFRASWRDRYKWMEFSGPIQIVGDETTGHIVAGQDVVVTCSICARWPLEAPRDRLGAGSGQFPRGVTVMQCCRSDRFRDHNENPLHQKLVIRAQLGAGAPSAPPPTINFKGVMEYQMAALKTAYFTVYHLQPINACETNRQLLKLHTDTVGLIYQKQSHWMSTELIDAAARWVFDNFVMKHILRNKKIAGKSMDGTTDRADDDAEFLGCQTADETGCGMNLYLGRHRLDMATSRDGESPDGQCIVLSSSAYLAKKSEAFADHAWLSDAPMIAFDTTSVNTGENNGVVGEVGKLGLVSAPEFSGSPAHKIELGPSALLVSEVFRS